jgi:PTH1 family peptidyl-tRNA hydrolase
MKYLIVGLGNIGAEYDGTRHNVGFECLDYIAKEAGAGFEVAHLAWMTIIKHKGRTLWLIKPTTYMNLSGKAVRYWQQKEQIPLENIMVVLDDLNLDLGQLRLRGKGSDGGHNGLKNIDLLLATQNYARLRIGIGNNFSTGRQVNYVLGKWSPKESDYLPEIFGKARTAVLDFATQGLARAMNNVNTKEPKPEKKKTADEAGQKTKPLDGEN